MKTIQSLRSRQTIQDLRGRLDMLSDLHSTRLSADTTRWDYTLNLLDDIVTFLEQREPLAPKRLGRYDLNKYGRKGKASNP